jgi:PTH1 family peptidyl-tRNA hydrolase
MAFDRIVAGLGNPGAEYAGTRHNAGALFIDGLSSHSGIALTRNRHNARIGEGMLCGEKTLLALPATYMNTSGEPISRLLSFTGTPPASLVVVHDDLDLPCGRIRLRFGGGAGGHNGIRSVIRHLHSGDFLRIKIGIGRPPEGTPAERYVLRPFTAAEKPIVEKSLERARDALAAVQTESLEKAMSLYNSDPPS